MTPEAAPRSDLPRTTKGRDLWYEWRDQYTQLVQRGDLRLADILAIEAEAAAGTALDVDLMREIVQNGVPPDALMVTDQPTMQIGMGGKGLYDWWHLRWAPTLAKVRARLAGVDSK